jgi:hypothetical protein
MSIITNRYLYSFFFFDNLIILTYNLTNKINEIMKIIHEKRKKYKTKFIQFN